MALTRIPYRNTGYFSSLICDLVDQHPALAAFQTNAIGFSDAFEAQIATKQINSQPSIEQRLFKALKEQYQELPNTAAVLDHVDYSPEPTTFTVTTGHQLISSQALYILSIKSFRP